MNPRVWIAARALQGAHHASSVGGDRNRSNLASARAQLRRRSFHVSSMIQCMCVWRVRIQGFGSRTCAQLMGLVGAWTMPIAMHGFA